MSDINFIKVYVGYETTDEYGRLGDIVGIYRTFSDADIATKTKGWYGGPGRVMDHYAIESGDNLYLLAQKEPLQFKDVSELREKYNKEKLEKVLSKFKEEELDMVREYLKHN